MAKQACILNPCVVPKLCVMMGANVIAYAGSWKRGDSFSAGGQPAIANSQMQQTAVASRTSGSGSRSTRS